MALTGTLDKGANKKIIQQSTSGKGNEDEATRTGQGRQGQDGEDNKARTTRQGQRWQGDEDEATTVIKKSCNNKPVGGVSLTAAGVVWPRLLDNGISCNAVAPLPNARENDNEPNVDKSIS